LKKIAVLITVIGIQLREEAVALFPKPRLIAKPRDCSELHLDQAGQ
jgi:hypothetical protein